MKSVAFFDFDGTLVRGDSLWPFLVAVRGWPRCLCGAFFAGLLCWRCADRRTAFKQILLKVVLKDVKPSDLDFDGFKKWPRWKPEIVAALRDHHAQGRKVVIASGSLDLYLHELLADFPVDAVLCTRMEVKDGRLTGCMDGGNCVRTEKAARVAAYIEEHGPFEATWAYGNAPHDLPMMEKVENRVLV